MVLAKEEVGKDRGMTYPKSNLGSQRISYIGDVMGLAWHSAE
jgi:hypothetical protein